MPASYEKVCAVGRGPWAPLAEEFNELPALRRMRGLPPMACSPSPELQLKSLRQTPLKPPQANTIELFIVSIERMALEVLIEAYLATYMPTMPC